MFCFFVCFCFLSRIINTIVSLEYLSRKLKQIFHVCVFFERRKKKTLFSSGRKSYPDQPAPLYSARCFCSLHVYSSSCRRHGQFYGDWKRGTRIQQQANDSSLPKPSSTYLSRAHFHVKYSKCDTSDSHATGKQFRYTPTRGRRKDWADTWTGSRFQPPRPPDVPSSTICKEGEEQSPRTFVSWQRVEMFSHQSLRLIRPGASLVQRAALTHCFCLLCFQDGRFGWDREERKSFP